MGLTIRQLEIFEKVASTEHITKASEQLYLSQS
ncbi:MAG: LysR family transcriptional regulator, partial [Eubacteriales bacterium]